MVLSRLLAVGACAFLGLIFSANLFAVGAKPALCGHVRDGRTVEFFAKRVRLISKDGYEMRPTVYAVYAVILVAVVCRETPGQDALGGTNYLRTSS